METWLFREWSFKRYHLRAGCCLSGDEDGERRGISQKVQSFSHTRGGDPIERRYSLVPAVNNATLYSSICWESKSYVKGSYLKIIIIHKKRQKGTSLVVAWLRLCTPNAGSLGSNHGQGTRSRNHK